METNSFSIKKYSSEDKNSWNDFVGLSKNGTFLFHRDFMDYHSHRFEDYSLLIFKKNKLVAVLPANFAGQTVYSHQGLTYGGLVLNKKTKFKDISEIFKALLVFLTEEGISRLQLKLLPRIYETYPADELIYLLSIVNAKMFRTDLFSVIDLEAPLKIASNRMEGVKKAEKLNLSIEEGNGFKSFWDEILIPNLKLQHEAAPVHSLSEIEELAKSFPKNIIQFNVVHQEKIVGGATIFETEKVAHVQYISANQNRQKLGTLDFLFQYLIHQRYKKKDYFDFGTSNENQGKQVNEGLLYWKECFGARSIAQNFYEVETANFKNLETLFL